MSNAATVPSSTWMLKGSITFKESAALAKQLGAQLNGIEEINWSQVQAVDSSAVSLALELNRLALRHGRRLRHVALPRALMSLANLYGVEHLVSAEPDL